MGVESDPGDISSPMRDARPSVLGATRGPEEGTARIRGAGRRKEREPPSGRGRRGAPGSPRPPGCRAPSRRGGSGALPPPPCPSRPLSAPPVTTEGPEGPAQAPRQWQRRELRVGAGPASPSVWPCERAGCVPVRTRVCVSNLLTHGSEP